MCLEKIPRKIPPLYVRDATARAERPAATANNSRACVRNRYVGVAMMRNDACGAAVALGILLRARRCQSGAADAPWLLACLCQPPNCLHLPSRWGAMKYGKRFLAERPTSLNTSGFSGSRNPGSSFPMGSSASSFMQLNPGQCKIRPLPSDGRYNSSTRK